MKNHLKVILCFDKVLRSAKNVTADRVVK